MKINNKGFLMAETIVTVCIIAALSTSMFLYVSSNANRFEERNNYENVVDVYKLNTIKQYLTMDGTDINTYSGDITSSLANIKNSLNIEKAYIGIPNNLKDSISPQSFKDYLTWLSSMETGNSKSLIVMFGDTGNGPTFANIVITE